MARNDGGGQGSAGREFVWGLHAVGEALRREAGAIHEVVVRKGKAGRRVEELITLARDLGVRIRFVDFRHLRELRGQRHQGVAARVRPVSLLSGNVLFERVRASRLTRLLVLDSIQDPRNLGSILRSALAAGFLHIILPRERTAPLCSLAASASAGAVFHLNLYQVVNLHNTLLSLKKDGFWVFGSVVDAGAVSMYEADFSGPVCLVMGSEGKGIRPLVQRACDQLVTIPMQYSFDSLNVSVAAALLMFEVVRQQQ